MNESSLLDVLWIYIVIAFIGGEAMGMIVAGICFGWLDKIQEKKNRMRGNASGSVERGSRE